MTDDNFDAKAREISAEHFRGEPRCTCPGCLSCGDCDDRADMDAAISTALRDAVKAEREACAGIAVVGAKVCRESALAASQGESPSAYEMQARTLDWAVERIRARGTPIAQVVQPKLNT